MSEISARITLDSSGYKSGVFTVMEENAKMKKSIEDTKRTMSEFKTGNFTAHIGVDTTSATRSISKMQENINALKKNVSVMISAKDATSSSISRIKSEVTSLVKSNFSLEIKALDKTKSVIAGIRDSIFNLKTLAAGIVLGAGAKQGFDLTIGNAMSNEQYLATLQTVLHDKKAGSEALKWSYTEAANTPFDAKQVVAGVTQLATSGLDFKKYLEPLGDAAAAFNKPLEQAIFAMGKLKSGQLGMGVDMLRDFGVSQQDWTKQGVKFSKNGEMQGMTGDKASAMALKILQSKYKGLMDSQSKTAQGMISNIGDTINGMGRGLAGIDQNGEIMKGGLFDNFKKQLTVIMPLLDKIQNSHAFSELQKEIGQLATAGGDKITDFLKSLQDPKNITKYKNEFKDFVKEGKNGAIEIGKFVASVGKIMIALAPLATFIASHQTLFIGIWGGAKGISMGISIFKTVDKLKTEFPILGVAISKFSSGAVKSLGLISKIFVGNSWVVAIGLIVLAVVGLYEAWTHNWGGCKDYMEKIIGNVEKDWEAWKKVWTDLKNFFKDPIKATIESVNKGVTVTKPKGTTQGGGSGPQGLAVDSGNYKYNALGTNYFEGGLTWINEVGPELVELPGGTKIHSNRETKNMLNPKNNDMSNQFAKNGEDIPNNLAKGIKKTTPTLINTMATTAQSLIQTFGTGITDNSKYPIKSTNDLTKNVTDIFTILGKDSNPLGQNVSQGLGQGMKDSENNVVDIAKTLTDKVIKAFTDGFDIHSPSRVMYAIGSHVIGGFVNGLNSKDLKAFADKHIQTITSAFGSAVNVPGGISQWLMMALQATGTPLSWLPGLQKLVMAESGGDPNNWNSQSVGGEHATGLLQTLPSTFKEFMQRGMSNILNPVDNAAAAINYIKSRYGSVYNTPLFRGGSYAGYANGGIANQPSIFGEGQYAEAAIPLKKNSSRSQQLLDIADNYINGDKKETDKKDVNLIINFNGVTIGEEEFFDKAGEHIVKKVKLAIQNM